MFENNDPLGAFCKSPNVLGSSFALLSPNLKVLGKVEVDAVVVGNVTLGAVWVVAFGSMNIKED